VEIELFPYKYYQTYPATPRHIHWMDFDALFKSKTIASRCSNLEGRGKYKGIPHI